MTMTTRLAAFAAAVFAYVAVAMPILNQASQIVA
mgnify:FL=1|jgi:hypothetical protein